MRRIGLLGGSFNPAHDGHRHISLEALKRLRLHEVWWMVSPQNPLKRSTDMAPFERRMSSAELISNHPRIRVTDIERRLGTAYTVETLHALLPRFPNHRFVWLMGADNLVQISSWMGWREIFTMVNIAVFARPSYSRVALSSKAARVMASARVAESASSRMTSQRLPAWVFLHTKPHSGSATQIRTSAVGLGNVDSRREVNDLSNGLSIGRNQP